MTYIGLLVCNAKVVIAATKDLTLHRHAEYSQDTECAAPQAEAMTCATAGLGAPT